MKREFPSLRIDVVQQLMGFFVYSFLISLTAHSNSWVASQFIFREDPLALLSGTLRTIQKAACDGETLTLTCPMGTAVSIQLAQYGRPSPGLILCPSQDTGRNPLPSHSNISGLHHDNCTFTPSMQHLLLRTVVEACMNNRQCKFPTTLKNQDLSVCPNQTKFVEVAYKCRPLEFRSKIICENDTINLKCKPNARIAIYSATFGRTKFQSLQCPQTPGVEDETCQASFSTETVMQICHGKRRCSLTASSSTFGNPCSPNSTLYLQVVYTCVSRQILKDPYQGDLEKDESENFIDQEGETSFESDDDTQSPQTSTMATSIPYHVADTNYKVKNLHTTIRPEPKKESFFGIGKKGQAGTPISSSTKSTAELVDRDMQGDISGDTSHHVKQDIHKPNGNKSSEAQDNGHVMGFITVWMTAVSFIKENQEKFILYITLSIAAGILVFLSLLIGRLWWQKRKARKEVKLQSVDPIPAFADDVSDIDNDIDLTLVPPPPISDISNIGPIPTSEGVRYSTRGTLRRQDSDTNPRSFIRNENSYYYYG